MGPWTEERLRQVLERVSDGFVALDRDWRCTYVNETAAQILGRGCTHLIGTHIWTECPDVPASLRLSYERAMAERVPLQIEEYHPPTNRWFEHRIYPSPEGLWSFFHDVTDRKRTELALSEGEDTFRHLFETAGVGMSITLPSGEIETNKAFAAMVGYTVGELRGKRWQDLTPREEVHSIQRRLAQMLAGEVDSERFEKRYVHKSGAYIWTEVSVALRRDRAGKPRYFIATILDVSDRKRTEESRRLSHEIFSKAFDLGPVGLTITRLADGRFVDANDAFCAMLEVARDEIIGHSSTELGMWSADERAAVIEQLREKDGLRNFELEVRSRSGRRITLLLSSGLVELGGELSLLTTFVDITSRKQNDEALRLSEERVRLATELADVAVWEYDCRSNTMTRSLNHDRLYGLEWQARWEFETFLRATHADDRDRSQATIQTALYPGGPDHYKFDFRVLHPDQTVHWLHVVGQVMERDSEGRGVIVRGCLIDVTEQKEGEEIVRRQLAALQSLGVSGRRLTTSVDLREVTSEIVLACVKIFGANSAWVGHADRDGAVVVLDQYPLDIEYSRRITVRWDGSPEGQGPSGRAIRSGTLQIVDNIATAADYLPWRAAALEQGFCTSAAFPLTSRGLCFGVLNVYSEQQHFFSSERVQSFQTFANQAAAALENARLYKDLQREAELLEERVGQRTAQLAETNAELDAFAYSVSHDLRAPLRAMQGFSQALLEDYCGNLDETGQDYARRVVAAAERMDTLIQDLLAYGRLTREEVKLVPVSLMAAVRDVLLSMKPELEQCAAAVRLTEPLPVVLAQRPVLDQVLTNLISNAVKFVTPGTVPRVLLRAEPSGARVRLWIEDNGIGIAAEHVPRVFRVFERLHGVETYPGTGIGLAIVRKGITRMGGQCGVESKPGHGSRFWIELAAGEESK